MKKLPLPPQRHFLGKTENFSNAHDRRFNQRMLRAYLKGHKRFNFGFTRIQNQLIPDTYEVLQKP